MRILLVTKKSGNRERLLPEKRRGLRRPQVQDSNERTTARKEKESCSRLLESYGRLSSLSFFCNIHLIAFLRKGEVSNMLAVPL